jgi:hypothetical protein
MGNKFVLYEFTHINICKFVFLYDFVRMNLYIQIVQINLYV